MLRFGAGSGYDFSYNLPGTRGIFRTAHKELVHWGRGLKKGFGNWRGWGVPEYYRGDEFCWDVFDEEDDDVDREDQFYGVQHGY